MATPEAIRTAPTKAKMLASSPVRGSLPLALEELEEDEAEPPLRPFDPVDAVVAEGDEPLPLLLPVLPPVPPAEVPCEPDGLPEPPWFPPVWPGNGSW